MSLYIFKAVKRVLEKTHKLNGLNLTIKRYQSPKVIANRTLVEALNPEISKGGIRNYLEGKSGDNVTFKQEEGTSMVTFGKLSKIKHNLYFNWRVLSKRSNLMFSLLLVW